MGRDRIPDTLPHKQLFTVTSHQEASISSFLEQLQWARLPLENIEREKNVTQMHVYVCLCIKNKFLRMHCPSR